MQLVMLPRNRTVQRSPEKDFTVMELLLIVDTGVLTLETVTAIRHFSLLNNKFSIHLLFIVDYVEYLPYKSI